MKTAVTIIFVVLGIILLALDRILEKSKVIKFDEQLSRFTERIKSIQIREIPVIVSTVMFVGVWSYFYYIRKQTDIYPPVVRSFIGIGLIVMPIFIVLGWMLMGGYMSYGVWKKQGR